MYFIVTHRLRRWVTLTLGVIAIYFLCHAYMFLSLWCPQGTRNCYSYTPRTKTTRVAADKPRSTGNGNGNREWSFENTSSNVKENANASTDDGSSIYSSWIPAHLGVGGKRGGVGVAKAIESFLDYENVFPWKNLGKEEERKRNYKNVSSSNFFNNSSSLLSSSSSSLSSSLWSSSLFKHSIKTIKDYHEKTMAFRQQFNCSAVFNGSQAEIQKIEMYHRTHRPLDAGYPPSDESQLRSMFYDCKSFRRIRGYFADNSSSTSSSSSSGSHKGGDKTGESFPIAYVILAHKDFDHIERLLKALYRPENSFCIHLDAKVNDSLKQAVSGLASCFPNVILASRPQKIVYAHASRLMADIVCMKDLLAQGRQWSYLINTAATAFPLRTNRETVRILQVLNGKNDIHEVYNLRVPARWKVEYTVHEGKMKPSKKEMPPAPHNLTVIKGQAYNTYSRAFLQWAFQDQRAKDLLAWSLKTYSPDEHYWATLNNLYHNPQLHAPGGFTGDPDKKGYITMMAVWAKNKRQGHTCQGQNIHNICVYAAGDLAYLSHQMSLTSNKFDLAYDPVAYSCMEEWLEKRTLNPDLGIFDLNRYKRLRFVWFDKEKEKQNKKKKKGGGDEKKEMMKKKEVDEKKNNNNKKVNNIEINNNIENEKRLKS